MTSPHDQSQYQVRFDWGYSGALTVASDVDVIVIVDVLTPAAGDDGGKEPASRLTPAPKTRLIEGSLRNRNAVAEWVLARQVEKAGRFTVAVIAVGEVRAGEGIRFAVEDQLAAGAIIDALAVVGIDYCSPEAAAACASFTGLRNAMGHLVSASASGKELAALGHAHDVDLAAHVDVSDEVVVLQEYVFRVRG
ncbi:MAG: 2-phosphosulfolactate phosphatase [Terrimesophilobacter sp.]